MHRGFAFFLQQQLFVLSEAAGFSLRFKPAIEIGNNYLT
jgi:hypothetical protein